jgi:hypothetical protein
MMKRVLLTVFLLVIPLLVHSDDFRKVTVSYQLTVEIKDTDYPRVTWEGSGPIRYKWQNGEGRVLAGDIPPMTQYCPVAIPGYRAVFLTIHGTSGTVATVKFDDETIVVSDVSLDLDVLEALPALGVTVPPPHGGRPMLHIPFPELRMTSDKLDSETMSTELIFTTFIPKTGNDELDRLLAGKTVAGRFRIALRNPYQK